LTLAQPSAGVFGRGWVLFRQERDRLKYYTSAWRDGVSAKRSNPLRLVDVTISDGVRMARKLAHLLIGALDGEPAEPSSAMTSDLLSASLLHCLADAPLGVERRLEDVAVRFIVTADEGAKLYGSMLSPVMAAHPDVIAHINIAGWRMLSKPAAERHEAELAVLVHLVDFIPAMRFAGSSWSCGSR